MTVYCVVFKLRGARLGVLISIAKTRAWARHLAAQKNKYVTERAYFVEKWSVLAPGEEVPTPPFLKGVKVRV